MESTPGDEIENKEISDNEESQDSVQPTDINSLLAEVASNIFALLNVEERQRIRGVCTRWRKIIDEVFGTKIRIKNSTSDLIKKCPHAFDVELHSMTIPFESGISFANSIKTLRFTSIVVTYNLANFLRTCSGIKTLCFANVVIDQPVGDEWSQQFWQEDGVTLANLEKIEIKCFNFAEGITDVTRLIHDKVQFGNLKEITISAQNPPSLPLESLFTQVPDMSGAHCILQLIWKNQYSLERFQIGRQNYPIIMKFLERSKFKEPTIPLDRHEYISTIQLEEFIVHPYFREDWAPVLRTQFNLKCLEIGSVNVSRWEDIRLCILKNSNTLETFTIGGLSFGQAWDCAIFESCHVLKSLNILISHSHKYNLHQVPIQLQHLHIFGPIARVEIMAIAENLQNLETLKFSHLGRIEVAGVPELEKITTTIVRALLKIPKLTLLSFIVCSSQSIDWDRVGQWIRSSFDSSDVFYEEHFYQMHGENCRNGMTLKVRSGFDREKFDWEKDVTTPPLETVSSVDETFDEGDDTDERHHHRAVHFNISRLSFP